MAWNIFVVSKPLFYWLKHLHAGVLLSSIFHKRRWQHTFWNLPLFFKHIWSWV